MNAQIQIISNDDNETINVDNIKDMNNIDYIDSYGANNSIVINNDEITINRVSDSHKTHLFISDNKDSYIIIDGDEGNIKIDIKVLAFERNNDIILLAYLIGEEERKIVIKYLRG